MTFIFFVFVLLFASLLSHSESADLADADYCIDWNGFDDRHTSRIRLVFLKKNNDLKYTQDSIVCIGLYPYRWSYSYSSISFFYFIDGSNRKVFSFESDWISSSSFPMGIDGRCEWFDNCSEVEYLEARTLTLPKMQIDFPTRTSYMKTILEKYNKDDLLRFKNKIIDAQIRLRVRCEPNLDTTYRIGFRARITGECDCDSTENKKDTQKNKN